MSLGQLCDDNFEVLMDKKNLYAYKNETLIIQGNRIRSDEGL